MLKFFNTAGPVNGKNHYCLPPLERINLKEIMTLIEQEKYFVLHAPRQTGKTTTLLALMQYFNTEGKYKAIYINVEKGQSAREDVYRGIRSVLGEIASSARDTLHDEFPLQNMKEILELWGEDSALNEMLCSWSKNNEKSLVIFIDEIDSLIGDTLISVLRQIRSGYHKRPKEFPLSIILCGVRDVRDYRIHSSKEKTIITGGSAFNIKAESLRVGNFSKEELIKFYNYHTQETGQIFEENSIELAWELTQGQPWLINALAYEVCFKMEEGRDRSNPITTEMIFQAKENLILRRETHLDQLVDKLREERVHSVISAILSGIEDPKDISVDDIYYARDLGLIKVNGKMMIANDIYKEIIPRELIYPTQVTISKDSIWYVNKDGSLNMDKLMTSFQEFFREHSESWIERFQYKEAGPQLLLQAYLQRIVNSDGIVNREYGLGMMRTDLMVVWKYGEEKQKIVIELKILHKSLRSTIEKGLMQTSEYLDKCGALEGHLVIFDRTKKRWSQKIFRKEKIFENKKIIVWGM
ncbi:MAG: ATP-binding protein [Desulfobacterales bacterium]|nr:ATP-binding protein [Desulfobacterales bacterium]MBF0396199.1 ATP-binding protein [Desulfobacterales bacterium]